MDAKTIGKILWRTYGPLIPTPRDTRETFLEKARERVANYKPQIEDAFEVNLGNIKVKDFKEYIGDQWTKLNEEFSIKNMDERKKPFTRIEKAVLEAIGLTVKGLWSLLMPPVMLLIAPEAKHNEGTIYFPFYFQNRFEDPDFKKREKELDQVVVHELSHSLWYALGGEKEDKTKLPWRLWNEGFATYYADIHFVQLYPANYEVRNLGSPSHKNGKEKVRQIVKSHGEEVLREIPKRWREFSNGHQSPNLIS